MRIRLALVVAGALAAPGAAAASTQTFGSDLMAPATLDTTILQPSMHNGADTFVWNTRLASGGDPRSPADGQLIDIKLKGCTNAKNGPVPGFDDTAIEFQDLAPQPDGSFVTPPSRTATGDSAGRHFELPLCSSAGGAATADTVTDYQPVNLCTNQGHYINLADNGGFNPTSYPNGVPYQVFGRVPGSHVDSYILYTTNGQKSTFRPGDAPQGSGGGFYANPNIELLLQATVGSGPDGTGLCAGGTRGGGSPQAAVPPRGGERAAVRLRPQRDGVNRRRIVKVGIYCALAGGCRGTASLSTRVARKAAAAALASRSFNIAGRKTSKISFRLRPAGVALIRKHHRRLKVSLSVTVAGRTAVQLITLRT